MVSRMPRILRRLVIASTAVLTAGLTLAAPAEADVTDPNMLQVSNGVTYEGCNDIPFSLKPLSDWGSAQSHAMGNIYGTYNYEVNLRVIGPDGTEADTHTVYRSADDTRSIGEDADHFFSCAGAGNYLVQATGYWCWVNYKMATNPDKCQSVSFQKTFSMRAAMTTTSLKGAAKTYMISRKPFKFTASTTIERSTGTFAFADAPVRLQYLKGSRWVTYKTAYSNSSGSASFRVKFSGTGSFKFRTQVLADDDYASSKSAPVRVRVTR